MQRHSCTTDIGASVVVEIYDHGVVLSFEHKKVTSKVTMSRQDFSRWLQVMAQMSGTELGR